MKFQWWDPDREVLSEKIIPSLELSVAVNPAYQDESGGVKKASKLDWKVLLAAAALLAVLAYLVRLVWPSLDPAVLKLNLSRLRVLLTSVFRRWIKAPNSLPPLNPLPLRKD